MRMQTMITSSFLFYLARLLTSLSPAFSFLSPESPLHEDMRINADKKPLVIEAPFLKVKDTSVGLGKHVV